MPIDPSLPRKSLNLIDYESLATILSLLIISRGLELSGILNRISFKVLEFSKDSELKLLSITIILTAISSAIIMNDTAIFIFIPLILTISRIANVDLRKAVVLTAIAANVGSSLTPIGNPQNIIIWRNNHIQFWTFVRSMVPYTALWLFILLIFTWMISRGKSLEISMFPKVKVNKALMLTSVLLLIANVALAEEGYYYIGLILTLSVMAFVGREAILSVDAALLAIFALIFIDFKEIANLLPLKNLQLSAIETIFFSAFLSQIISNVPATVMLLSNVQWLPLAIGANIGGTGMIMGSLANFIALRLSGIDLRSFHRYSLLYFSLALLATIIIANLII